MAQPWQAVELHTRRRIEVLDITDQVAEICRSFAPSSGLLVVSSEHTTAGLCLNEAEAGLMKDIEAWLERITRTEGSFAHNAVDDNADAHLRAILVGHSICVPVVKGAPGLGRWQRILFVELDGPRTRRAWVKVVGE